MARTRVCHEVGMGIERLFARAFVVAGGLFWIGASFGAPYGIDPQGPLVSARNALLPLALTIVVFVLGLYNERMASALLSAGVLALVAWGIAGAWEAGPWILFGITLMVPMAISSLLYFLAADMQRVCDLGASRGKEQPAG